MATVQGGSNDAQAAANAPLLSDEQLAQAKQLISQGYELEGVANRFGVPVNKLATFLQGFGLNIQQNNQGKYVVMGAAPQTSASANPTSYQQGGRPANVYNNTSTPPGQQGSSAGGVLPTTNPNAGPTNNNNNNGISVPYDPTAGIAANDLAEKKREFNVTTARDIAKQNATEVDALQQRLAALSGPKDAYADYFFSHGLLPPQGYKPAPVPLTQAQTDAYGKMGVTPQQLQGMIGGTGQPGADFGMLGSLGNSLQTPAGLPQPIAGQAPPMPQGPSNPTAQGGALYGKTPPGGSNVPTGQAPPTTPGGVPSMAVGGQVPGQPGVPTLAVLHGGEQVTPAPGTSSGQPNPGQDVTSSQPPTPPGNSVMDAPGLHPAIAALVDAVSGLLSNPDFRPFVAATQNTTQATSGGVQSMAFGGTVQPGPFSNLGSGSGNQGLPNANTITHAGGVPGAAGGPIGVPNAGVLGGAQGMQQSANTTAVSNPIMPLSNMDPYTRALYDVHGRLHPYSAQQETQMGPQGLDAVSSYVSRVQGGDINAYKNLVDRLRPSGAPAAGDVQSEGFTTG